ncbi:MAG: FHA domain-containing serine/threonine-protein kinase [Planctomycetota bacterium]|jgi:serine/threonine-protein kinase|nr:FHA domain-containing serine/threonine-protein kinase [Planctomycetota bacterium]
MNTPFADQSIILKIEMGPDQGRRAFLPDSEQSPWTLGRSIESSFPILDSQISSHHSEIRFTESGHQIRDLSSRNGTYVNNEKIFDWHPLSVDDVIRIGTTELSVKRTSDHPTPPTPSSESIELSHTILTDPGSGKGPERCPRCLQFIEIESTPVRRVSCYVFCSPCIENEDAAGRRMKNLTLLYELGRGAIGVVYRARHELLEMDVAVKILHSQFSHDSTQRERFLREARIGMSLVHPHILRVHDIDHDGDQLFLTTEYIPGQDLSHRILEQGPQPLEFSIPLGIRMAQALHFGHSHEVIHRDVKPGNILLDENDIPRLADFNIARAAQFTPASQNTPQGVVIGTLRYMAPEQLDVNRPVDHRADLYALGATLFHTLTGEPPFNTDNRLRLIRDVLTAAPPLASDRRPDLPAALDQIFQTVLAQDPSDRYPSGSAFAEALAYIG